MKRGRNLEDTVLKDIRKLEEQFCMLETSVFDAIGEKHVSFGTFGEFLAHLFPEYELEHKLKDFFDREISHDSAVKDIWKTLSVYWNYFNPSLLGHVITKFGDKVLRTDMEDYNKVLGSFQCKICLHDLASTFFKQNMPDKNWKQLTFKHVKYWNECKIEDLNALMDHVAQKFHLPPFLMTLQGVANPDCIHVTWAIPAMIGASLKENMENMGNTEMREFCKGHGITAITIDGEECKYSPVKKYSAYLKDLYSHKEGKNLVPFKLARIEKKEKERKDDSIRKSTLQEDQDDVIYSVTQKHMDESEIGHPKYMRYDQQPRLVLIEGAPGVGKTTFSEQFCYKWSRGQLLSNHTLLVLLPLRDENVKSARNVSDFFQHPQLQQAITEEVLSSGGEGVALWLEALDELGEEIRHKSSIFMDLVHGRVLPKATIIITSRPWATKNLRENTSIEVDQLVEILSTPNVQFGRILRENRVSADIRSSFINHMNFNPIMKAAMYTPATANIVAEVFQWCTDSEFPPPTTMTQLYTAFTCNLLTQYLFTQKAETEKCRRITSLVNVPATIKKQFLRICELAWEGIVEQQLIFSSDVVDGDTLGLMHGVRELYELEGEGGQLSYNFIHLTLQEFLSAYHIAQLPLDKQKKIMQKYVSMEHLDVVVRFYFGLTKPDNFTAQITSEHIADEQQTTAHHWLYEAGEVGKYAKEMRSDNAVQVMSSNSWSSLDYYVLGYCIAHYHIQWSLDFTSTSMGDGGLEMLCKGMASSEETDWGGEVEGYFAYNNITVEGMEWFVKIPLQVLQHVKELDFSLNKLDGFALDTFSTIIPELTKLEVLSLNGNPIGKGGAIEVLKTLYNSKSPLKELDLSDTKIGDDDCTCLSLVIANLNLEELRLSRNNLSAKGTAFIIKGLLQNSTIQTLHMSDSVLFDGDCASLAASLLRQLKVLELNSCSITSEGAVHLASALSTNHSLTRLDISGNSIGDIGAAAFGVMVKNNSALEELLMNRCGITSRGCVQLADGLTGNTTLKELMIGENLCGVEGARSLSEMIEVNKTLKVLYLHGDHSIEGGIETVVTSIQENTTLRQVYFSMKFKRPTDPRIQWSW